MRSVFLAVASLGCTLPAMSQTAAVTAVPSIVITGNPLGRDTLLQPSSVLQGDELLLRRAASLGETLEGLPGVVGSGFGPHASRPVIRGLDGDRIRLLDNGAGLVDASNLSFDHAAALDPLVVERIEVLRGPATLLYGGNALGGVVNTLDNRIPRAPASGLSGRGEVRLGGGARERGAAAVLDGGAGAWAWHADVASRSADDLRTPRFVPAVDGQALPATRRVPNSAADSQAAALGAAWVSDQGHLGLSIDRMDKDYGVTVEPEVTLRMLRERLQLGGQWRALSGPWSSVSVQGSRTRYAHEEIEGSGEVGTRFASHGDELRAEFRQRPLAMAGSLEGMVGAHSERLDFSALGEEAFVPSTHTHSDALFVLQELKLGRLRLSAGARAERVRVRSAGDADGAVERRFGAPQARSFSPRSLSLSGGFELAPGWSAQLNVGRSQRAPAYYELYANGLHLATSAFEVGNPALGLETSRHVELGLRFARGHSRWSLGLFSTRFARYVALRDTGRTIVLPAEEPGEPDARVPEYRFEAVAARLAGFEFEASTRLAWATRALTLSAAVDSVRGDDLDRQEPLPRLPPLRVRLGAAGSFAQATVGVDLRHQSRQARTPATDSPTAAATLLDLWARGSVDSVQGLSWYARLANIGDALAYNAAAVATVRPLAPQGGRAFAAGLQWRW